jgi:hypothetical protein
MRRPLAANPVDRNQSVRPMSRPVIVKPYYGHDTILIELDPMAAAELAAEMVEDRPLFAAQIRLALHQLRKAPCATNTAPPTDTTSAETP